MLMLNVKTLSAVQGLLTHLHTPAASCEILKTEQLPPHSYHILKLRQSNNMAQKKPYRMSEINKLLKKKLHLTLSAPPNTADMTSNKCTSSKHVGLPATRTHTHIDVIYLWLSTRKLDANGVSESPQI